MILDLNTDSHQKILDRLNKIEAKTLPQWGKMNASEMIRHCRIAMELPLGRLELKPNFFFKLLFGKWIKNKVTNDEIYKPGAPTAPEFKVHNKELNFETEKTQLINTMNEFVQRDDSLLAKTIHPIFGTMTSHEWRKSQWKHLDHHFRQFGV